MKKSNDICRYFLLFSISIFLFVGCASINKAPAPPSMDAYSVSTKMNTDEKPFKESQVVGHAESQKNKALDLVTCVSFALQNNPARKSADASISIAEEAAGMAMAPYYPEIYATAGYSRFQKHAFMPSGLPAFSASSLIGPENDWTGSINAKLILWDFGERRAKLGSKLAEKEAVAIDAERIRQDIITGVYRSFYSLMAARQAKEVALKNLERAESHLKTAETRYELGAVPKTDVLRARVGVADSKLSLVRTESMISITSGELCTIMGLPVETSIDIKPALSDIRSPEKRDLDSAFIHAKEKRPELKAAMYKISSAISGVEEAKSGFLPKIKGQAGYGWEDDSWLPEDKIWSAGITFEMPIFSGFAKTHNLTGKKAALRREEAEAMRLIQGVRQEVWKSFARLKESFEAFKTSESMVKEAEESHRSTKERYDAGASTITDLLDARVSLAKAEANQVTSRWDYFIAEAEFKKASGDLK